MTLIDGYLTYKRYGVDDVETNIVEAVDALVNVVKQNDGLFHNRLLESLCKALDTPVKFPKLSAESFAFFKVFFN